MLVMCLGKISEHKDYCVVCISRQESRSTFHLEPYFDRSRLKSINEKPLNSGVTYSGLASMMQSLLGVVVCKIFDARSLSKRLDPWCYRLGNC